jgi:hypothetical protein
MRTPLVSLRFEIIGFKKPNILFAPLEKAKKRPGKAGPKKLESLSIDWTQKPS